MNTPPHTNKEKFQCEECKIKPHYSDCAVHNEPAEQKGECSCGGEFKPREEYKCPYDNGCNSDCDCDRHVPLFPPPDTECTGDCIRLCIECDIHNPKIIPPKEKSGLVCMHTDGTSPHPVEDCPDTDTSDTWEEELTLMWGEAPEELKSFIRTQIEKAKDELNESNLEYSKGIEKDAFKAGQESEKEKVRQIFNKCKTERGIIRALINYLSNL